jgi:hypothetical protein
MQYLTTSTMPIRIEKGKWLVVYLRQGMLAMRYQEFRWRFSFQPESLRRLSDNEV